MKSHPIANTVTIVAALLVLVAVPGSSCWAQQPIPPRPVAEQIQPLSRSALEALVAPYAPYPDTVVERVFDAAQHPTILHEAAQSKESTKPRENWPDSVQWIAQQPVLLQQLNRDVALTARLGIAAKQQLEETWRAVDSVRQRMQAAAASGQPEKQQPAAETAQSSGSAAVAVPVVPYSGAVAAALWTDAVVHELQNFHQTYHNANGTAGQTQGQANYGSATVGNTTYYGATGSGTVTGPGGNSATGSAQVSGTVTQNGNTTSFHSNAAGSVQTNLGYGGTATRSGQGSVTENGDGSVSFQQSGQGSVNGNQKSGSFSHSSSGTITGNGDGNYQGNTTVQTQQGTVSTSTTGGNGQLSTTVDSPNGSNTYTLGDGQAGGTTSSVDSTSARMSGTSSATERPQGTTGRSRTSSAAMNPAAPSSLARPRSVPGDARFQGFSAQRGTLGAGNADRAARSGGSPFGRPQSLRNSSGKSRAGNIFGRPSSRGSSRSFQQQPQRAGGRPSSRSNLNRSTPSRRGGGRRGRR